MQRQNLLRLDAPRPYFAGTAPVVPPDTSPSGQDMPTGDLPGWQLQWANDFNVDVPYGQFANASSGYVSTTWDATQALTNGQFSYYFSTRNDSSKRGSYDPANYSVSGGILNLHMYHSGAPGLTGDGKYHVGALLPRHTDRSISLGTKGGRFAIRYKATAIPTYKLAWLLWPDSGKNTSGSTSGTGIGGNGEIDYPEHNLNISSTISENLHWQDGQPGITNKSGLITSISPIDIWHTTVLEWRPNDDRVSSTARFLLDGSQIAMYTGVNVPNQLMHWVLQSETFLTKTDGVNFDPMDDTADGVIAVDWLVFWKMV